MLDFGWEHQPVGCVLAPHDTRESGDARRPFLTGRLEFRDRYLFGDGSAGPLFRRERKTYLISFVGPSDDAARGNHSFGDLEAGREIMRAIIDLLRNEAWPGRAHSATSPSSGRSSAFRRCLRPIFGTRRPPTISGSIAKQP